MACPQSAGHGELVWRRYLTYSLVAAFASIGCRTDQPFEPPGHGQPPSSFAVYSSDQDCARVTVQIGTNDQVTATFPLPSACQYGLVLLTGGEATGWRVHPRSNHGSPLEPRRLGAAKPVSTRTRD